MSCITPVKAAGVLLAVLSLMRPTLQSNGLENLESRDQP